ncbi:unnamed protein product, partial [Meganyctiphanes norvegica]
YSVFYNDDIIIATMVEAAAAKKVVKAKKPAAKPLHPPFAVMIAGAIKALKERGGSSRQAILKYILANNKIANAEKAKVSAKLAIRKMLAAKKLVPVKGSFKLAKEEPKPKKAKKVKKPAAKKVKKAKKPSAKKAVKKTAVKKAKKPAKKVAKKPVAKKAAKKPAAKKVAKKPAAKKVAKK